MSWLCEGKQKMSLRNESDVTFKLPSVFTSRLLIGLLRAKVDRDVTSLHGLPATRLLQLTRLWQIEETASLIFYKTASVRLTAN